MAINSTTRQTTAYTTGNNFAFAFKVFTSADVKVIKIQTSNGAETVLNLNSDYTVTLNGDQDNNPGGSVTLSSGTLGSGSLVGFNIVITSKVEAKQLTELTNQGGFFPSVINNALDKSVILHQQQQNVIDKTIRFRQTDGITGLEITDGASARATKTISFDSNGNVTLIGPVVTTGDTGTITTDMIGDNQVTSAKIESTDLKNLSSCQAGSSAALSDLTQTEVQILHGATVSTTELNKIDGLTAVASDLNKLNGMTATTENLSALTGITAVETSVTTNSNTKIPTSKAVNDLVLSVTNALGGFVAIANATSFPTSHPDPSENAGTVVSITDANGIVVNSSGVATIPAGAGQDQNGNNIDVTINGFPTDLRSKTLGSGIGLQVQTTTTLHTYDYHKALVKESDLINLSNDIDDFKNRYRVVSTTPTSDNDEGDIIYRTSDNKLLIYNGTAFQDPLVGNFYINTLSSYNGTGGNSATFNGSAYRFNINHAPEKAEQLLVSINGVIQKPNSGTSQPTGDGFALDGDSILFGAAPASGSDFFIITIGKSVNIGVVSDGSIDNAKVASDASIDGTKINPNFGSQNISTTGTVGGVDLSTYQADGGSYLRSDADDSFTGTITGTSDSTNPVLIIKGGGPNIIRFDANDGDNADTIDLIYRTTPNTLAFERRSDAQIMFSVDADDQQAIFNGNVDCNSGLDVSGILTVQDASGSDPTMQINHSDADVTGEFLRVGRTDLSTIRYHSIKAKHGGAATANLISFNLHNASTTTSQTEVLKLNGDGSANFAGHIDLPDDATLKLGDNDEFQIYHRGSDSVSLINEQGGGYLSFGSNGSRIEMYDIANARTMAQFNTGGSCVFKHAADIRLQTTSTGIKVDRIVTIDGSTPRIEMKVTADEQSHRIEFYNTADSIVSRIYGHPSGDLELQTGSNGNEKAIKVNSNGAVDLHFDGGTYSTPKLSTTADGVDINGKLDVSGTGSSSTARVLGVLASGSTTHIHSAHIFSANISNGQTNNIYFGKATGLKKSASMGYKYYSDGSDDNLITFSMWGANDLVTINGQGNTTITGNLAVDTDTLFVDSTNDRVGINNASPSQALDVTGQIRVFSTTGGGTTSGLAVANSHDNFVMCFAGSNANLDFVMSYGGSGGNDIGISHEGAVKLSYGGSTTPKLVTSATGVTIADDLLLEGTDPSVKLSDTQSSAHAFIDGNGGNLNIHADKGNNSSNSSMGFGIDNNIKMTLSDDGYLGIGLTNPARPLTIRKSDCRIRLEDPDSGNTNNASVELSNNNGNGYLNVNNNNSLNFQTDNTARLTISGTGDVELTETLKLQNNKNLNLGGSNNLVLKFDGSVARILADSQPMYLKGLNGSATQAGITMYKGNSAEKMFEAFNDGAVKLYYDAGTSGSPKLSTSASGIGVTGTVEATANLRNSVPSDFWNSGTFIEVGDLGHIGTHGSFEFTITSGGYRRQVGGVGKWKDIAVDGVGGFGCQVALSPKTGKIHLRSNSGLSTDDNNPDNAGLSDILVVDQGGITVTGGIGLSGALLVGNEINMFNGTTNSHRFIDCGLGDNNDLRIRGCSGGDANHENMIVATRGSSVRLHHDGATTAKLETTATGITVDGNVRLDKGDQFDFGDDFRVLRYTNSDTMTLQSPEDVIIVIDNNNNETNKIFAVKKDTTNPDDGSGTELFKVEETGNATITGSLTAGGLTFPTANGTDGQVLTSDGAGNVQWEDATGGGSTFNGGTIQNELILDPTGNTHPKLRFVPSSGRHFYFEQDAAGLKLMNQTADGSTNTIFWRFETQENEIYQSLMHRKTADFSVSSVYPHINAKAAHNRSKIRLYSGSTYEIGTEAVTYGGLDGTAITFQTPNIDNAGFLFTDSAKSSSGGVMAITSVGEVTIAHSLRLGYGGGDTTTPGATHALDVSGSISSTSTISATTSNASSSNNIRKITTSTSQPSGGADGDIWIVVPS